MKNRGILHYCLGQNVKRDFLTDAIANPEKRPFIFIFVVVLALGVATNGLSTLILEVLGEWIQQTLKIDKIWWQLGVVSTLIVVVLLIISNIWQKFFRGSSIDEAKVFPLKNTFPGLIVLVSLGPNPPARAAIERHWNKGNGNLGHCWLICGGERSLQAAETLVAGLVEQGIPPKIFHYGRSYEFSNLDSQDKMLNLVPDEQFANDPNYIRRLVDCIFTDAQEKFKLDETQVIADYTGGTKSMTAGIILACATPTRRLQYILSEYDENNKPMNSQVMEVEISYKLKPIK
jgi:CRISPR-associated protein (Cas_Cas02710)